MDLASLLASALGGLTSGGAAPPGAYAHQGLGSDWLMPDRLLPQRAAQPQGSIPLPPMRPPQAEIDAAQPAPPIAMPAVVGPPDALGPVAAAANAMRPGQSIPTFPPPPQPRPTTIGLNILRGPFMG
jgi:hypothetical protein